MEKTLEEEELFLITYAHFFTSKENLKLMDLLASTTIHRVAAIQIISVGPQRKVGLVFPNLISDRKHHTSK